MNRFAVVALLSSIALFGLSFFVLQRGGPKSKLHRIFFFLSASTAFWIFDTFMLWFLEDKQSAWLWRNINYPFVAYIPALFAHLILIVLKEEQKLRPLIRTSYVISTLFAVLSLTDLFIADIRPFPPYFNFVPVPGPLFHMFIAFFYGLVGYVHLRILFVWDKVSGQERTQLVYLLIAFLVGFAGTAIFFLLVYGINFEIYVPHDLVSLAFSLILAYAIVRHQLLDIEVVIKRTLQFAGLVGSVVAVVSLVAFVSQDLLARFVTIPKWASNILAAAIIAVLYEPLRNWLTEVTDKYLFQKKYDYKDLLKKFTDEVMVVLDLKRVGQMTVNTLTDSVKLDTCTLLLLNKDTRKYEVAAAKGLDNQKFIFDEQEQFITFLREIHEPIWLDSKIQYPPSN